MVETGEFLLFSFEHATLRLMTRLSSQRRMLSFRLFVEYCLAIQPFPIILDRHRYPRVQSLWMGLGKFRGLRVVSLVLQARRRRILLHILYASFYIPYLHLLFFMYSFTMTQQCDLFNMTLVAVSKRRDLPQATFLSLSRMHLCVLIWSRLGSATSCLVRASTAFS